MRPQFPLFQSHIDLAHSYWNALLREGDWAIDATCGNGKDTIKLAEISSGVIALDIQQEAIDKTKILLQEHRLKHPQNLTRHNVHLFCQSHAAFPEIATHSPIRLIVYNLGYLPGSDKQVKTQVATTILSLYKALELLMPGGMLSITCYPGHEEGAEEEEMILKEMKKLSPSEWSVCHHQLLNRNKAPSLILIQRTN